MFEEAKYLNIIGRIYRALSVLKMENGFKVLLKIKSNFGGTKNSELIVSRNVEFITISTSLSLIVENKYFSRYKDNIYPVNVEKLDVIKLNDYEDIKLNDYDLIKPDKYNLYSRNIKNKMDKDFKGIKIPIILEHIKDKSIKIMFIKLEPFIKEKKEYIKLDIEGDILPITIDTNEEVCFI